MDTMVWKPDILGDGYEMMRVALGSDYSGPVASTVVRRRAVRPSRRAVLYVHGFSDYFLQADMGREFNRRGYNFYAVDLRKYGRSHLAGQTFFEVRSLREYFPDIEMALSCIEADGNDNVVLAGHSTGGLTASLYMAQLRDERVRALVLNSPFLSWNLPWYERMLIPLLSALGRVWPSLPVRQPKDTRYARSLRRALEGEWEYRTDWKPDQLPDVDAGWVRAIEDAQRTLRRGAGIYVPVLVLTSTISAKRSDPMEVFHRADGVLNVRGIRRVAPRLGPDVTIETIPGGLHDLALSAPEARQRYYEAVFRFINRASSSRTASPDGL